MAGKFELFVDARERYRFRLKAADGTVMAVSKDFETKRAAVVGIREVRACAGMGLITDLCPSRPAASGPAPEISPALAEEGPPRVRIGWAEPLSSVNAATKRWRPSDG